MRGNSQIYKNVKIWPNKADNFFVFRTVFATPVNCPYLWNQLTNSTEGGELKERYSFANDIFNEVEKKEIEIDWLETHFTWLHHIPGLEIFSFVLPFLVFGDLIKFLEINSSSNIY